MVHRAVSAGLLFVLLLTQFQLWVGAGSKGNVEKLRAQLQEQLAANDVVRQKNERLASEVQDLRLGREMVEEKARSDLGMVRQHEIFVQIVQKPSS